jgi:hypothetical protein
MVNPTKEQLLLLFRFLLALLSTSFEKLFILRASSILTGFASPQLLVYKNKAAFAKRNADAGNEEPLDPTLSLDAENEEQLKSSHTLKGL